MRSEVYKGRRKHSAKGLVTMLVVFALTVGACSGNATEDELADGVIRVTAKATLKGDAAQTRTDYTEVTNGGMTVKWTTNDAFTVFQQSAQQTFTLKGMDSDGKGHFSGTLTSGAATTLYALYPAAASTTTTTVSSIALSVAGQTQANNGTTTHLSAKDFMRASADWNGTTGNVEFGTFTHLMAVLRLDIELPAATNVIKSIVLSGMNATQTLNLTKGPVTETVWSTEKPGNITLTTTGGTSDTSNKYTAYLMVFPTTTLRALTITVNLADSANTSYTKEFTSNTGGIALKAGNRYWITVKDLNKVGGGSDSEDIGGGGGTGGGGTGEGDTGGVPF